MRAAAETLSPLLVRFPFVTTFPVDVLSSKKPFRKSVETLRRQRRRRSHVCVRASASDDAAVKGFFETCAGSEIMHPMPANSVRTFEART